MASNSMIGRFKASRKARETGQAPPVTQRPQRKPPPQPNVIGTIQPQLPTFFELPFLPMNRKPSPYDPTNVLLAADYLVGEQLGSGVTAYVYRCKHRATGHEFALKCIDKTCLSQKPEALQTEVFILSHVQHPCIVSLVGLYEDDEYVYLILPLMRGGELFTRIIKVCPNGYTERHAARIMKSILLALQYLHGIGIVHRDLKPENLLFPTENIMATNVQVSDFGLAKIWTENTLMKTACGSPNYVAPEVLMKNAAGYTCAADMWSAGVIAYVVLCGFAPFHHESTPMLLKLIIIGHYSFPSPYWDTITPEAMDFVSRLLVRDPSQRATATDALEHPWIKRHAGGATTSKAAVPAIGEPESPQPEGGADGSRAEGGGKPIPNITETLQLFHDMCIKEGERRRLEAEEAIETSELCKDEAESPSP